MQRSFDILFSGISLICLSPILLPIILILRLTGEGEIFFLQNRVGYKGDVFKLYKFATMLKDSPNIGTGTVTTKNDPRILPFGGFLRKTKVNELPQLINVFIGNMSIIGPRPQTQRCFEAFPLKSQKEIIKTKPGLSGIGSIIFRNEEEMINIHDNPDKFYDEIIMPYKGSVEEWYVSHKSLLSYFSLIGFTVLVLFGFRSSLLWRSFKDLPLPPEELEKWIKNPNQISDYEHLASLHHKYIDQGFLTSLGIPFLTLLYEAIDKDEKSILLIERENNYIVGYVTGTQSLGRIYRQLLMRPFLLAFALKSCLISPTKVYKIIEVFFLSFGKTNLDNLPKQELLSIVVDPAYQGRDFAEKLFKSLCEEFKLKDKEKSFKIVVGNNLERAHAFYLKMGSIPVKKIQVHKGVDSVVYIKKLE